MQKYYVDLHIHIGRTHTGKAVKITGSRSLTFTNIIHHARNEKGLNMIGIIDSHSPEVIIEMEELLSDGILSQHSDGGIIFGDLTIIPGSELEIYDEHCQGPIHVLCFFPTLEVMKNFSMWLSKHLKNIQLSSQRIYVSGKELQSKVKELGGLFIPAHVFTPFKSLYGKGVKHSLTEVFDPTQIDAVELGLSSNTMMADEIAELHQYTYISNSDAHSLAKIAREYQVLEMEEPTFKELEKALKEVEGRRIIANYGLDPFLGKYHQTACANCSYPISPGEEKCSECGERKFTKGVSERIKELHSPVLSRRNRPPYIHQVPLDFIPGLGPKMLTKLLDHFGTEMAILHEVPYESIANVVPIPIAELIWKARNGDILLQAGGGGKYGKIAEQ
jgi:uncharacterized protein (TIGR00375 family)